MVNNGIYPLVNVYITMERSTILNGKINYKWQFSIAIYVSLPGGIWIELCLNSKNVQTWIIWIELAYLFAGYDTSIGYLKNTERWSGNPPWSKGKWCFMDSRGSFFSHLPGELDFIGVAFSFPLPLLLLLPSPSSPRALPEFNWEYQISLGTAGPQLRAPDLTLAVRSGSAHWDLALAVEVQQCPCQRCQIDYQIERQNRFRQNVRIDAR